MFKSEHHCPATVYLYRHYHWIRCHQISRPPKTRRRQIPHAPSSSSPLTSRAYAWQHVHHPFASSCPRLDLRHLFSPSLVSKFLCSMCLHWKVLATLPIMPCSSAIVVLPYSYYCQTIISIGSETPVASFVSFLLGSHVRNLDQSLLNSNHHHWGRNFSGSVLLSWWLTSNSSILSIGWSEFPSKVLVDQDSTQRTRERQSSH